MASEDSDEIVPGFSPVHLFGDLSDLDEPVHHKMAAGRDQLNTSGELLEVLLLRAQHRVLPEERNDRLQQIDASSHDVAVQMLAVIVKPLVLEHLTNTKELAELVQTRRATRALRDHELVRDLPAGLVAVSPPPASLAHEADREASFSVYKTNNPATSDQSFLLIFRITRHVVTVDITSDVISSAGCPGFPAYSQMHTAPLPTRGAANCLQEHSTVLFGHVTLGRL